MAEKVFVASAFVLAAWGLLNAAFLWYKHQKKKQQPMVCPLNHNCSAVTESKFSTLLGVRNEVLGALFFAGMIGALVLSFSVPTVFGVSIFTWILLGSAVGLAFSVILVAIQAWALKDYCFYCIISAGITLLLFLNSWLLWKG